MSHRRGSDGVVLLQVEGGGAGGRDGLVRVKVDTDLHNVLEQGPTHTRYLEWRGEAAGGGGGDGGRGGRCPDTAAHPATVTWSTWLPGSLLPDRSHRACSPGGGLQVGDLQVVPVPHYVGSNARQGGDACRAVYKQRRLCWASQR